MHPAFDLSILQKTYDLTLWYVPILNKWPRDHKFLLGDRIGSGLYDLLEELVICRYEKEKLDRLQQLNGRLDLLRTQTRLALDFKLMDAKRYETLPGCWKAWGLNWEAGSNSRKNAVNPLCRRAPMHDVTGRPLVGQPRIGAHPYRVLRGGSWNNDNNNYRSAIRNNNTPDNTNNNIGFRVVLPVPVRFSTRTVGWEACG